MAPSSLIPDPNNPGDMLLQDMVDPVRSCCARASGA